MTEINFRLSAVLRSHESDVRCLSITSEGDVVSGSRDKTVKIWKRLESGFFEILRTYSAHGGYVSSVCTVYLDGDLIISGCNDSVIRIFDSPENVPVQTLKGHSDSVCGLSAGFKCGTFLSCSWDKTAILWDLSSAKPTIPVSTFIGHEAAVWCVIQFSRDVVVTGSADKTLKLWDVNGLCTTTLFGHEDCVRDVACLSEFVLVSCANDGMVKLWNIPEKICLFTIHAHQNYIYTVASISSIYGDRSFITGSEDGTFKVWIDGECKQMVTIPAQTVWSIIVLPNSDLAVASSDHIIRIFTQSYERTAPDELQQAFQDEVILKNLSKSGGKENEVKTGPPQKNQTKLVREGNATYAYRWFDNKWHKIGEVTGGGETKKMYKGKEYDTIVEISLEGGKPSMKLPYNNEDDPWEVAVKFIQENNLSTAYLDEIVSFIEANKPKVLPISPFSDVSRSVTGSETTFMSEASSELDVPGPVLFPCTQLMFFARRNDHLIKEKLVANNGLAGDRSLEAYDLKVLFDMLDKSKILPHHCPALSLILAWPTDLLMPVADLIRVLALNVQCNMVLTGADYGNVVMETLFKLLEFTPSQVENAITLFLRTVNNLMSNREGETLILKYVPLILEKLNLIEDYYGKNLQVALSTFLLNSSIQSNLIQDIEMMILLSAFTIKHLKNFNCSTAIYRILLCIGTLLKDGAGNRVFANIDFFSSDEYAMKFIQKLAKDENKEKESEETDISLHIRLCARWILDWIEWKKE